MINNMQIQHTMKHDGGILQNIITLSEARTLFTQYMNEGLKIDGLNQNRMRVCLFTKNTGYYQSNYSVEFTLLNSRCEEFVSWGKNSLFACLF